MNPTIRAIVAAILLFSTQYAMAGSGQGLSTKIACAHKAGTVFQEVSLFNSTTGIEHPAILEKESILQALPEGISALYQSRREAIILKLHNNDGKEYSLELLKSSPISGTSNMGYIDAYGKHRATYNEGLHYQGIVAGSPQSMAALSVFENGDVMLLFANEEGNFIVGKLMDGSGKYIFYNDRLMKVHPNSPCGVTDEPGIQSRFSGKNQKTTAALVCKRVQVYWEVGYGVYTGKASNLINTQNYISGLFNQFAALYANEQIAMELKSMYVWISPDLYPKNSSMNALSDFVTRWNGAGDSFDGDIAHLITQDSFGNGGRGYLDVLCNKPLAYSYSDIQGFYQAIPTYSWDVSVVTHETGHNLGSNHTHWCGWMTGTGGACGAIDNCAAVEITTGCSSCSSTYLNSASPTVWQGTIMSYCHLTTRGINLASGFGPLPGNLIRGKVSAASCLSPLISAKLSASPICINDGLISLSFAANNYGTAPYSYTWSDNSHSQNLANISIPGKYSVSITDSNGCTANYDATIVARPDPGNGISPKFQMPICCNAAAIPLKITASSPQNLTSCQSVYWLRSKDSLGSFADVKAYFDTTQPANLLASSNKSTISNTEGAMLNVYAPANCDTSYTYYYTPIVVQLPQAADTFTYKPTGSVGYVVNGVQIGNYIPMPNQLKLRKLCNSLNYMPDSESLSVTVSGYTGRANQLTLIVQDSNNVVVYQAKGLAGNGTYVIPAAAFKGALLQELQISAFDYNCSGTFSCVSSAAPMGASRVVMYAAKPLSMLPGCVSGTPVRVDFARTGCTKLAVPSPINASVEGEAVYPNPATKSVTVKFVNTGTNAVQLKVTDLLGKVVFVQNETYTTGLHQEMIDVSRWAKGLYIVHIDGAKATAARLKLVVE